MNTGSFILPHPRPVFPSNLWCMEEKEGRKSRKQWAREEKNWKTLEEGKGSRGIFFLSRALYFYNRTLPLGVAWHHTYAQIASITNFLPCPIYGEGMCVSPAIFSSSPPFPAAIDRASGVAPTNHQDGRKRGGEAVLSCVLFPLHTE